MHFVKVGQQQVNLEKVAKVKEATRGTEYMVTVVFSDETVMPTQVYGKDARQLWDYLTRVVAEEVLV